MESHPHQSIKSGGGGGSNRGAMEGDRLSSLPDDLLHAILRGLPLKQAVRTSALSRRWARQWLRALAASRVLDLTDRDFARGQPPARAAATVSRCLRLHAEQGSPLDALRVALACPSLSGEAGPSDGGAFGRDVIGWIAAAVRRGAREVEVDLLHLTPSQDDGDDAAFLELELPGDLFQARNSLERVALGGLSLRAVRLPAAGLAGLRSLSLSRADVTDEAVRGILASCGALESLSLRSCSLLTSVRIASERLRDLQLLGCCAVQELWVAAPALESLTLYGNVGWSEWDGQVEAHPVFFDVGLMPALSDAYLSHLGCGDYSVDHDNAYPYLYYVVAHVRILTLCSIGLKLLYQHAWDDSAFSEMPNLEELQLLLASPDPVFYGDNEFRQDVSAFFMLTPLPVLQHLFLRLPSDPGYGRPSSSAAARDESDDEIDDADTTLEREIVFGQLSLIKVVNFRGTKRELWLLTFLLERAPSLEQLVLVTPEGEEAPADEQLKAMQERVSELQRSSREARVSVCRPKEDDSPNHAHTRFFHEDDEFVTKSKANKLG